MANQFIYKLVVVQAPRGVWFYPPKYFYRCCHHHDPHLFRLFCCPTREPVLAGAVRMALARAQLGSSTEDDPIFTEGASRFGKPVFEKGTQLSSIEYVVASVYSAAVLLVSIFYQSATQRWLGGFRTML
jgi:hypothetical protein